MNGEKWNKETRWLWEELEEVLGIRKEILKGDEAKRTEEQEPFGNPPKNFRYGERGAGIY